MSTLLHVREDGTEHTLSDTGAARLLYRIAHPGCDAIVGRVDRGQALRVMDDLDAAVERGDAELLEMDEEAFVRFRHAV